MREKLRCQKETAIFFLVWFFVFLLPETMTKEGIPHALRSIGVIPAVYIIVAYGFYKILLFLKRLPHPGLLINPIVVFVVCLSIFAVYYRYFYLWAKNNETKGAFTRNWAEIAKEINKTSRFQKKYVICEAGGIPIKERGTDKYLPMSCQTVMYLTDSFLANKRHYHNIEYLLPEEKEKITASKNKKEKKPLIFEIK